MEIWRILLIILVVLLLLAFSYTYYSTFKFRTLADRQALEKPPRVIDQTQNSYSIMPSQFNRKTSNLQKDFIDSFIELSKEPISSTALVSTAAAVEKPKAREEGEPVSKTDRSIDFLLATTTTRRGYTRRNERAIQNPDHTQIDMSYIKPKNEPEKVAYDIREDIEKIEKEVASITNVNLFKSHIWKEFLHYHYILALAFPKQRKKPIRHHVLYNSSLYLVVLYILSFLASELGVNSLANFSLVAIGLVVLTVLLLFVIYSIHNTQDDCLVSELLPEERAGEDHAEERINALLIISQKRFTQEIVSKLVCMVGLAAGIGMFSRLSTLDAAITRPLFGGFMVVFVLDITVVRNILIVILTGSLGSVIRKRMVKERVRELVEKRAIQTNINYGQEANKKLFTIQQDARENYASNAPHDIKGFGKAWGKKPTLNQETNRITFENELTGSNEHEETEFRRNRIMSFSDKERPENRINTIHSEAHTEDIVSRPKDSPHLKERDLNSSFAMSPANRQKNEQPVVNQPSGSKMSASKAAAAKFSIFIPPHEFLTKRAFSPKKDYKNIDTSIMKENVNMGHHYLDEDRSSDNRIQSIGTLSKGMDTDKLPHFEPEVQSKSNTQAYNTNQSHHTHQTLNTQPMHTEGESEHRNIQDFNEDEVPEENIEIPPEENTAEEVAQSQYKSAKKGIQHLPAEFLDELEAEIDESIEKKRTLAKPELTPVKEPANKDIEKAGNITLISQADTAPKETGGETIKAASIASAKKALANFKADWFESLSLEKKEDVVIPNPVVNAQIDREEDSNKPIELFPVGKDSKVHSSDTSLSLPVSSAKEEIKPLVPYAAVAKDSKIHSSDTSLSFPLSLPKEEEIRPLGPYAAGAKENKVHASDSLMSLPISVAKEEEESKPIELFAVSRDNKGHASDTSLAFPLLSAKEEEPKPLGPYAAGAAKENKVHGSDTSLSLPHSLAYLDEKSHGGHYMAYHQEPQRDSTLRRMLVRKESILSQEEFRNEVENFMKHFPKPGANRRNPNVSDSENDVELSRNDFNLSIREESERRIPVGKEPIRENQFVLHERENNMPSPRNMIAETGSYVDLKDDVKGAEWLGYDAMLTKRKQKSVNKAPPTYEERKAKLLKEELEKSRRKKKPSGSRSRGALMPSAFNLDKLSEVSKTYGFKIQQKGPGTSNQDIIISKLDQKRKSTSVDRPVDEELIENQRLPRVTKSSVRSHRRVSIEDRREVKSLNKLSSLPEIKELPHKPY